MDFWPATLGRLVAREDLSKEDAADAMRRIMAGEATPAQIAAFVVALRSKGETSDEVGGLASAMLELAPRVDVPGPVVDTCGTGGDRAGTINVSTMAAIVSAGAGAVVAKHGNRAASSRCGSADLLEALGVKVALDPAGVSRCLHEAGIGFMFAPVFHAAMAHAAGPRKEMGIPTVFNFLGPLTNPARPAAQVVGVSNLAMLPVLAGVLARRGTRAYVFRGSDGLDELTTTGPSTVFETRQGDVETYDLDPATLGVARASLKDLEGGDPEHNGGVVKGLLVGEPGPARDIVVVNAGLALSAWGQEITLEDGMAMAIESIDSGKAANVLSRWIEVSNRP
jgi:anthranilate phosphoribosyltransferase